MVGDTIRCACIKCACPLPLPKGLLPSGLSSPHPTLISFASLEDDNGFVLFAVQYGKYIAIMLTV